MYTHTDARRHSGFQHVRPIEQFDIAVWDKMMAVMLTAPFLLCQAFLPGMKENGMGGFQLFKYTTNIYMYVILYMYGSTL